jgi:hypothetical protein
VRLKPSSTVDEIAACQRPADKEAQAPITSAGAFVGNDLVVGYSSCPNRIHRVRSMRALTKSLYTAPQAVPPASPGARSRLCRGEHRCPRSYAQRRSETRPQPQSRASDQAAGRPRPASPNPAKRRRRSGVKSGKRTLDVDTWSRMCRQPTELCASHTSQTDPLDR